MSNLPALLLAEDSQTLPFYFSEFLQCLRKARAFLFGLNL